MYILVIFFVLGLIIGSFLNALEYRIGSGLSITKGRSICPSCKEQIVWYDNIPVISFILLRGKCRQCKKPISWQYPVVELLTGVAFMTVSWKLLQYPISNDLATIYDFIVRMNVRTIAGLVCLLIATSCLLLIALHDAKTSYIVSSAVYVGIIAMILYYALTYTETLSITAVWNHFSPLIIATTVPTLLFAGLHFFSKGKWMGAGDIELAALVGLFAGWPGIFTAFYFSFIAGAVWGLALVYLQKKAQLKSEMPFGPFLVAGAYVGLIFGQQIFELYARIFLGA